MFLKCKMCGDNIEISHNQTNGSCESCGSVTTLPRIDEEKKLNLFNRANNFRLSNEFDKSILAYEGILEEDSKEAEAYWGLVLSKYGIEYVVDPLTRKRIPTCHRTHVENILMDSDYKQALAHTTDLVTKRIYEEEAKVIAEIQKGILAISQNEDPYDVFICYKETDDSGRRTIDSTIAQDIYYQLKNEGLKVFFARITLEDKIGSAYEPYIFSALNSSKVMVVVGTKPEYYNATWVRNEWSRYLAILKNDRSRLLVPCYRDMDAYELPDELSMLQSQDMSKIGFIQDLIRGIMKVTKKDVNNSNDATSNQKLNPEVEALIKRGYIFLEDEEYKTAKAYFNKVLDINPECAEAYMGLMCADYEATCIDDMSILDYDDIGVEEIGLDFSLMKGVDKPYAHEEIIKRQKKIFENDKNYSKAVRYSSVEFKQKMNRIFLLMDDEINEMKYNFADYEEEKADTRQKCEWVISLFSNIENYKDSKERIIELKSIAEKLKEKELQESRAEEKQRQLEEERRKLEEEKRKLEEEKRRAKQFEEDEKKRQRLQTQKLSSQESEILSLFAKLEKSDYKEAARLKEDLKRLSQYEVAKYYQSDFDKWEKIMISCVRLDSIVDIEKLYAELKSANNLMKDGQTLEKYFILKGYEDSTNLIKKKLDTWSVNSFGTFFGFILIGCCGMVIICLLLAIFQIFGGKFYNFGRALLWAIPAWVIVHTSNKCEEKWLLKNKSQIDQLKKKFEEII